jgi:protein gp37
LRWEAEAAAGQRRERVFCASMADVFEWRADLNEHRARLFQLIDETPNLDWLLLTKRPQHILRMTPWRDAWPHNVWVGTTVENQRFADLRLPQLLRVPARVRFLSCEPLLGPLNLRSWFNRRGYYPGRLDHRRRRKWRPFTAYASRLGFGIAGPMPKSSRPIPF